MLDTILNALVTNARAGLAAIESAIATAWAWLLTQPMWLAATLATAAVAILVAAVMLVRRAHEQARRVSKARARATAVREDRTTLSIRPREAAARTADAPARQAPARVTPATASAAQARELVLHGVPAIEISRRTGLARDAVSFLLEQTGREARKGRPSPAGVAASSMKGRGGYLPDLRA